MPSTNESPRNRLAIWQADRMARSEPRTRVGLTAVGWAALSLILVLMTLFFLLLMDGRSVVHAAERTGRPWSSAMAAKDWPAATKLIQAHVKNKPDDAGAQGDLGRALLEQGQISEAEIHLISAESLEPSLIDHKIELADLYEKKGRDSRALAAGKLQEAINMDPSRVDLRWRLARNLFASGSYDECLAELRVINRLQPDNLDAYRLTADVAMGRGNYQEAIDNLKVYTAVVPDGRGFTRLAQAYMSLTPADTAAAQVAALQALQLNANDTQASLMMARATTMSLGQKGLDKAAVARRADAALAYYRKAGMLSLSARDWDIVGRIEGSARKNLPGAEVAYWNASSIDTTDKTGPEFRSKLGSNLLQQQKFKEAIEVYEKLVKDRPKDATAQVNLGQCYYRGGDPDKGLAAFEKALELDPNSGAAFKGVGDIFTDKGRQSDATDAYRNATRVTPKDGGAWDALGYALFQQKNYGEAVPALEKSLDIDSCNTRSILTICLCLKELGRTAEAIVWAKKGLACDPSNASLKQMLLSLGGK